MLKLYIYDTLTFFVAFCEKQEQNSYRSIRVEETKCMGVDVKLLLSWQENYVALLFHFGLNCSSTRKLYIVGCVKMLTTQSAMLSSEYSWTSHRRHILALLRNLHYAGRYSMLVLALLSTLLHSSTDFCLNEIFLICYGNDVNGLVFMLSGTFGMDLRMMDSNYTQSPYTFWLFCDFGVIY